jgi:hypothetical protein
MAERPIEDLTLREMFSNAEWLIRDLTEHLQQSFYPRSRSLLDLVRTFNNPAELDAVPDGTVRSQVAALLGSDEYSQTLFQKLDRHLAAIEERSQTAISAK